MFLLFFIMIIFELLNKAVIQEITLGPIKITDITIIQKLIPVIVAYIYYEQMSYFIMRGFYIELHNVIILENYKSIVDNNLENFFFPVSTYTTNNLLLRLSGKKNQIGCIIMVALLVFLLLFYLYYLKHMLI